MKTHIVRDITDPFLKNEWERLEREADVFPQSTHHWCSTWWKHLAGRRKPHVVVVSNAEGRVVGIAPLCIEHRLGARVLRSFPVNYGDFFQFIVAPGTDEQAVFETVLEYMNGYAQWNSVLLGPVNDKSPLYQFLRDKECPSKHLVGNIVADIAAENWQEYAGRLSRNRRMMTQKKMHSLEGQHRVDIELVRDPAGYAGHFERIREIIDARGGEDRPKRSDVYMECVRETNLHLFGNGRMVLYLVKADDEVVAYRIGIVHGPTYYDWNTSYDRAWSKYSPGQISVAYVIRDLISRGFTRLDFMAGVYDFKLTYSPQHEMRNNHLFVMGDCSVRSNLFCRYQLVWRDRLKPYYQKMVRRTSRHPSPVSGG